jgi:hypothetical protein
MAVGPQLEVQEAGGRCKGGEERDPESAKRMADGGLGEGSHERKKEGCPPGGRPLPPGETARTSFTSGSYPQDCRSS